MERRGITFVGSLLHYVSGGFDNESKVVMGKEAFVILGVSGAFV
eukprot:CAMPEP_0201537458 /NCGR_PEP_ID=MMETSP0161_2-20130828/64815_1 /ASSEMBLY_ACC=CAM_ASM_000251 /TAXON_ID=180227 /ORGANISM="Neoparamoeba aestuarina, Strain SoJaBio B1-5/56/2" /LENGTH=43 /DNA_ID= /DNA_START= /DNA_END= /DNA_ORIENTATION=